MRSDIIIGSGPSGLAAAKARLALGRRVTIIDVGSDLPADLSHAADALAKSSPTDWAPAARDAYCASNRDARHGLARFGSEHAVRPMQDIIDSPPADISLRSSQALGGLSNLWGAAVLPLHPKDIAQWPVTAPDLAPHFKAVSDFMPIAGAPGGLSSAFQLSDLTFSAPLPESRQGSRLVQSLARIKDDNLVAGPAWQGAAAGCTSCGLCLYGCPYRLIFSSAAPIRDLGASEQVTYVKGEVQAIAEAGDGVEIVLAGRSDPLVADKVFVAAGVLETARILFASRPEIAATGLTLRESRHFFTPFLASGRAGRPDKEPHHTMVQAFVELTAPDISPWLIHSQIYGWNDFYTPEMVQNYGKGISALRPIFAWLSRRLFAAQTFLHSEHCASIRLTPSGDATGRMTAELIDNPDFDETVARARSRVAKSLRAAGLFAVGSGARLDPVGGSFHIGATLPMSDRPTGTESDSLGRPFGARHIHIVDASVLPSIPSTTITFPVMANAHRIATNA